MSALDRDAAWRYLLDAYARPGAAENLLRRQQEDGLDIVLHLFFLYATEAVGTALGEQDRRIAGELVKPWREGVIAPLRNLRRAMKELPGPAGGGDAKEALRQSIKQAELKAEQLEFNALCEWFDSRGKAA
jgi:uncharacterized protein (TIGR02444 family)